MININTLIFNMKSLFESQFRLSPVSYAIVFDDNILNFQDNLNETNNLAQHWYV